MILGDVIQELRKLNIPVPRPLRLPTSEEVEAVEKQLGVGFHPDYRQYLLEASDVVYGCLEPATVAPGGGHRDLVHLAENAYKNLDLPRNLLPICEDNGDYFCMNQSGKVVFWSHNGASDESWPDLATWIEEVWIGED
jgi:hypothetical protein